MKRAICLLLSLLLSALCAGCGAVGSGSKEDTSQLTYYYTEEYPDLMVETIERYNRWCNSHSTKEMKIELIEFEDFRTMSERLNIEVMSGGGPDLFSNYMDLPFEKLIENGAFYDLNALIENDSSKDKLNLSLYNQTIMDAGVFDGKRYFIPTFYTVDTLTGEKNVFEKFNMPTEQGFHLTFENMKEVFSDYLKDPDGYRFISEDIWNSGVSADTVALKLISLGIDFETQTVSFDDSFKEKLEILKMLRAQSKLSEENTDIFELYSEEPFLFNQFYAFSNPIWMERIQSIPEEISLEDLYLPDGVDSDDKISEPVLYSCFEKDEDTYSAAVSDAVFVNAKTAKTQQALEFIKYLLGEHLQNLYAGTDEEYWSGGGSDALPVLSSALEYCFRDAHIVTDLYGSKVGMKEELNPTTKALTEYIKKINHVELYNDLSRSNYNKNIAIPILTDYWDGLIDVNKCADRLSSATKIYLME